MDSDRNENVPDFEAETQMEQPPGAPACPACGGAARRAEARFCATCGRGLDDDGYLPADAIRSSYHYQRRRTPASPAPAVLKTGYDSKRRATFMPPFHKNHNGAAQTSLAFVTYALVPYLGILFCPGALLMGGIGLLHSHRMPQRDGRRASLTSIALGLLIFAAQIFLWWILYKVPEWTQQR